MDRTAAGDDADLGWLRQCDALCDAFESAWIAGPRPNLAEFVEQTPVDRRPDALRALLPLDWDYRTDAGEAPQIAEYTSRWPEHAGLIAEVLAPRSLVVRPDSPDESVRASDSTVIRSESLAPTISAPNSSLGSASLPDSDFGEYTLIRELGRGGMGVVYLARHARLNRFVALKVIRSGEFAGSAEIRRFEAEAAAAAQLDHPGIVPVFEAGRQRGHHYLAMAYVEGESLWHRVQDRPLEPSEAARLVEQVATAIQHAHQRGVVHRDLKPQNILLSADGLPRVTDFGLARQTAADSSLTASGDVLGTPGYMPPEQASGRMDQVGPAADIYSLGATLYCVVTGRPPFQAANPWDTLRLVCEQEPVSPRALNPAIARDLETICLKCLRKDPRQRYAAAAELATDLHRFLTNEPIHARPVSRVERGWRWCLRNQWIAGASAAAIALLIAVAVVSTWAYARQKHLTTEMGKLAAKEKLQRERAEVQLHHSQVARGANALDAGNFTGAEAALDDTAPLDMRGWEYRYLKRRLMGTPLSMPHSGLPLLRVASSPDGQRLATGSIAGDIDVWSASDGLQQQHFRLKGGSIRSLIFHPSREELIVAMLAGEVTCWNLNDQQPRLTWKPHSQPVGAAALTADGLTLATASADATVKLWNLDAGTERLTFRGHQLAVQCLDISPDGKTVVSGGAGRDTKFELIRWKLADGEIVKQITGRFNAINSVKFHPDGTRLAVVVGFSVALWDASSLEELQSLPIHNGAVTSVAFSPDGTRLATTSFDGQMRVFDARNGEPIAQYGHHAEMTQNAVFSPDGYRLASVSGTLKREDEGGQYPAGELKVWNLRTEESESWIAVDERNVDPVTNYLNAVDFQPGTSVVATGGWRGKVRLVDVISRDDVQPPIDFGSVITSLTFHPRLPILAIAGTFAGPNGGIALFDLREKKLTPLRGHSGQIGFAKFSPDGSVLATTGTEGVIRLWNPETGKELGALTGHKPTMVSLTFSPDGRRLVSRASQEKDNEEIKVWDVKRRAEVKGATTNFPRGLLSPDGLLLAHRGPDGVIEIRNTADGALRHQLRGHLADVPGLVFTSDGRRLVTSSRDQTIRLWDPREGIEVLQIPLDKDLANDVAISSDGSLLACATQVGTVRVWDARLAGDALKLKGHSGPIDAYGFAADGRLLSRETDGKIIAWSLPTGLPETDGSLEDPSPLPATSPDGNWTVAIDRRDRSALVATRLRLQSPAFQPWEEATARLNRLAPTWHAEDAKAAEACGDWFAAAFHLSALLEHSADAEVRQRLKHACTQLDAEQKLRPGNGQVK